jgi:hypothetical protein
MKKTGGPAIVILVFILIIAYGLYQISRQPYHRVRHTFIVDSRALIAAHELPNPKLTPGAVRTTDAQVICTQSTEEVRYVPSFVRHEVYQAYGNSDGNHTGFCDAPPGCEVDHLISLGLGGSNDPKNLWPEPYTGVPWNARLKDRLENELHDEICDGQLGVKQAQGMILANWVVAYCQVFQGDPLCSQ